MVRGGLCISEVVRGGLCMSEQPGLLGGAPPPGSRPLIRGDTRLLMCSPPLSFFPESPPPAGAGDCEPLSCAGVSAPLPPAERFALSLSVELIVELIVEEDMLRALTERSRAESRPRHPPSTAFPPPCSS